MASQTLPRVTAGCLAGRGEGGGGEGPAVFLPEGWDFPYPFLPHYAKHFPLTNSGV